MSDVQIVVQETAEEICDHFCHYNQSVNEEGCWYCRTHEGRCPFDKLFELVGLK